MAIQIPASPMKRKMVIPISDTGHVANRAFPPATATVAAPPQATRTQQPSTTRARKVPTRPAGAIPAPAVPTDGLRPSPASGRHPGGFYEGEHGASGLIARPEVGSSGYSSAADTIRMLHARYNRYSDADAVTPATLAQINAARRHVREARCRNCAAWLHGVRAGTVGQRQVGSVKQAARAQAEKQAKADDQMAAKQPERYIATMARRFTTPGLGPSMAAARVEHTTMVRASR